MTSWGWLSIDTSTPLNGLIGLLNQRMALLRGTLLTLVVSHPAWVNVKNDYGAIFDGASHPLQQGYSTLQAAQAAYPHATSLLNELDWAATQKGLNALPRGGRIEMPIGTGIFNKGLSYPVDGLELFGQGGHFGGPSTAYKPTSLDFSTLPTGLDAITASGSGVSTMGGIKARGFYLYMPSPSGQVGGAGFKAENLSGLELDIYVACTRGSTSYALQLGSETDPAKAVTVSPRIFGNYNSNGTGILVGSGCTDIDLQTYVLGSHVTKAGIRFKGANYCRSHSGVDSADGYGYEVDGCRGIGLTGGAENCGKSAVRIVNSVGTEVDLVGVGNNTAGSVTIPSYVHIDTGISYGTIIPRPVDVSPNAATTLSIRGDAGNLETLIGPYNVTSLPKLVGGDATWLTYVGETLGYAFKIGGNQIISRRKTGYTNLMTGVANRGTAYDTTTITLQQLAERVKAIEDDLHSSAGHGLLGP